MAEPHRHQPPWEPQQSTPVAGSELAESFGDDESLAVWCHILPIALSVFGALITYVAARNRSSFARHHAVEALNFSITILIVGIATALFLGFLGGLIALLVVFAVALTWAILGAFRASEGVWWRYPLNLRLVRGSVRL